MNAPLDRKAALQGMGDSRLRKEDAGGFNRSLQQF